MSNPSASCAALGDSSAQLSAPERYKRSSLNIFVVLLGFTYVATLTQTFIHPYIFSTKYIHIPSPIHLCCSDNITFVTLYTGKVVPHTLFLSIFCVLQVFVVVFPFWGSELFIQRWHVWQLNRAFFFGVVPSEDSAPWHKHSLNSIVHSALLARCLILWQVDSWGLLKIEKDQTQTAEIRREIWCGVAVFYFLCGTHLAVSEHLVKNKLFCKFYW